MATWLDGYGMVRLFMVIWLHSCMAMWPWYMAIRLHGYSAMALYGCIWLCVYTASVWVNLAVCNSMALRLRSYVAVWLYGYTAMAWYGCLWLFWLHGYGMDGCIWLYGYMSFYGLMAT